MLLSTILLIYSLITAIVISCLVFISNNSFSISVKSILDWCNVSSISSLLCMNQTSHISTSSSKNSFESLNSFAYATFNASSYFDTCSFDEIIVSINKLGPFNSLVRSTSFRNVSPLLILTTSNSYNNSLKHLILLIQRAFICFNRILEGRFCSLMCVSLLKLLLQTFPLFIYNTLHHSLSLFRDISLRA
jgi:hypothetical protein